MQDYHLFFDFITKIMEVFVDDFTVHGDSFEECLLRLTIVLWRCIENNLDLNFESCHFMVEHGVVFGHIVSAKGIEVEKPKVDIIQSLPYPQTIRQVRSFLGHFEFYCRFIKDFSKISSPLCALLAKDACSHFNKDCMKAFDEFFCFLDGYSQYIQIPIAPEDKEKTTFTWPLALMLSNGCRLAYLMHQPHFKDA